MPVESQRPILSTPRLADFTGLPARSLPTSTGAHVVVIVVVLLLGLAPVTVEGPLHQRQAFQPVDLQPQPEDAPVLPEMQSSSASASSPASQASLHSAPGRNGPSSASSMPRIHQRRQHIISNTPDATNPVQTILQPDIPHPPLLTKTLPIPSMVRMAPMRQPAPVITAPTLSAVVKPAAPPTPAPEPHPTLPKVQSANLDTVPLTSATDLADSPKLAAYATNGRTFEARKPPPPPPPAAVKPSAPKLAANDAPSPPSNATPAGGTDTRNLLVVNAIEVQSTLSERDIPAGEIHGRFEVAASPSLPEAPTTGGSSSSAGVNGSGVASSGTGAGKGTSKSASGAGTGGTHGNGAGTGGANVAGVGAGHGAGMGNGAGSGTGHAGGTGMGNGSGNGSAGGNGSAPFSGMTIVGGSSGNNNALRSEPSSANVNPNDPRGSYGMTILSNGGSGGAVRDYGVFTGGPVYTVYLDLAKLGVHGARWSFQYSATRDARIAHPGVPLTPPLPQDERLPQLPAAVVAANVGRLVVIQANLKPDGKLEGFHVLESPDQRLNEGIIISLTHWYFDPAAMGTDKVAVKVLFGIPIAPAMADNGVSQQADQHMPSDAAPRTPAQ